MADELYEELEVTDATHAVEDQKANGDDNEMYGLVQHVESSFQNAKSARFIDEQRWLRAYRDYRGLYGPDVQFTSTEKSRAFIKVTKTKVLAAYGQIIDVLFGGGKFPLSVVPTTIPENIAESVHFKVHDPSKPEGQGALPDLEPGDTHQSVMERLGSLKDKFMPVQSKLKEGPGTTPQDVTIHPAQIAASKMEKKIFDDLEESNAVKKLCSTAFECALFGTGIIKGPYAYDKEYPNWDDGGDYTPTIKTIPMIDHVSVWQFYPDPDAGIMDDAEFVVQRYKLSRSKLRKLGHRPFFRKNAIKKAIGDGENYVEQWWESQLEEEQSGEPTVNRFEVLEYWGNVEVDLLKGFNVTVPAELAREDQVSANVWICNGELLRVVLNPFKPTLLPYYAVPYEVNPYNFFGVGVAENMKDTQLLMNGFMRMAIDNAALSGNLLIEIDEDNLTPGQDLEIFPGKVFSRHGGAPGQSIFGTKFPNVSNENMQMFDKARQLADESTGIPSFSHGQTGVTGVGRTSSGISMLMGAAAGGIKTVIKNIDEHLIGPLGKSLFHFHMQFDPDEEIKGDLEVHARGTNSLMADEVRSQRLMQFMSLTQGQQAAPFAKIDYILKEIAKSLDLDPDKVVNNMADAALQAEIMAKIQAKMQPPEQPQIPGGPPSVADTQGSGNGNIGIGQAPGPQEAGFSGNVAPANADTATAMPARGAV